MSDKKVLNDFLSERKGLNRDFEKVGLIFSLSFVGDAFDGKARDSILIKSTFMVLVVFSKDQGGGF